MSGCSGHLRLSGCSCSLPLCVHWVLNSSSWSTVFVSGLSLNMVLASIRVVCLGTFAFLVFWVLAVFPSFKLLPIGRTAGAIAGSVLIIVFKVETPIEAYKAVNLSILGLLFGTMVICRQKNLPPKPFLIALATSANIGSVATPIGNPQNLVIAIESGISFGRFLMGLLPSMVLGVLVNTILLLLIYWKQLSLVEDLDQAALPSVGSSGVTKEQLTASPSTSFQSGSLQGVRGIFTSEGLDDLGFPPPEEASQSLKIVPEPKISDITESHSTEVCDAVNIDTPLHHGEGCYTIFESLRRPQFGSMSPIREQQRNTWPPSRTHSSFSLSTKELNGRKKWYRRAWKSAVYVVTAAMLAALLYGLDLSWTALTAAVTLMALDFCDAGPSLDKVSYPLLVFFAGMFITVDGFNTTGIPSTCWEIVEPYAHINDMSGVVVLTCVVIILSNVSSNVPIVLMMRSLVTQSAIADGASVTKAWLILAWASTIAGNLTLVGSAANLIVSEQAMRVQFLGYNLTFFSHLVFGFPSTLIVAAVGLPFIRG